MDVGTVDVGTTGIVGEVGLGPAPATRVVDPAGPDVDVDELGVAVGEVDVVEDSLVCCVGWARAPLPEIIDTERTIDAPRKTVGASRIPPLRDIDPTDITVCLSRRIRWTPSKREFVALSPLHRGSRISVTNTGR